ncbi:MgtC/SapB family protein [Isachenkonia alkalipeptolytica]|uniref:MgtC/SapB family protein n=1 Tax=Isachenkonia alkalipeptolytica TaxID=2565777 RepID=A0AA44BCR5_9CLOT|nr:MgtC/SapB family protein [Isachenkonia alkalipeptolytica]NBG87163.1 MgtC/SapB family protein [Isachenkonia alkalipeptolytica]
MVSMEFLIRIIFAFLLGGAIGFERQQRQRMAGVRTNVLVSLGAFLFITLSTMIEGEGSPTRMAAQVVSGIGFLGAGVIIRQGTNIRGLNTAATLWCAAAIGVLTGFGFIAEAVVGTIFILFANIYLRLFLKKINLPSTSKDEDQEEIHYRIKVRCNEEVEFQIRALLIDLMAKEDLLLSYLKSEEQEDTGDVKIFADIVAFEKSHKEIEELAGKLSLEKHVTSVGWKASV